MSNKLGVAMINSIISLKRRNCSNREIARILGVYRGTVNRYVSGFRKNQNQPNPRSGASGPPSKCEVHHDVILKKLETGLSAQRIYQDLVLEHGFTSGYDSVNRYVRKLLDTPPFPCRRMECSPGEEAQVDFGRGAPVVSGDSRRGAWVFRIVLSNSRKAYSESVHGQTTENFIRALENAFRRFGGVPKTLVIDNLRAAVRKADWFEPELNPKVISFCEHYGTVILPTRPYTPEHKGKVESSVKYVKNNALKGKIFASLAKQNEYLRDWEKNTADKRIHGTIRKQVEKAFEEEKPHLQPLPFELFECFEEGRRKVHRDGYVEVDRSYYMVPEEYCGREVWARWNNRTVRVFNMRFMEIAFHTKKEPGKFSDIKEFISEKRISAMERGNKWIIERAAGIGPNAEAWARAVTGNREKPGIRVVQGLLSLRKTYSAGTIEDACERALAVEAFHLKDVKSLLKAEKVQRQFTFFDTHPLIRNLDFYGDIIKKGEFISPEKKECK